MRRSKVSRSIGLAAGFLAVVLASGCATRSETRTPRGEEPTPLRIEENLDGRWGAACGAHGCSIGIIFSVDVPTPESAAKVDVDVTATLENFLTNNGPTDVWAFYRPKEADPSFVPEAIPPGSFEVSSPADGSETSTTLTWSLRGLEAAGRAYVFEVAPDPEILGTGASLIIDVLPSEE